MQQQGPLLITDKHGSNYGCPIHECILTENRRKQRLRIFAILVSYTV